MKLSPGKQAMKRYRISGGNLSVVPTMSLKKEKDLSHYYYPGILSLIEKIQAKPIYQKKVCSYDRTMLVIGTGERTQYPLLTARAGLISYVSGMNAFPLLIEYDNLKELPNVIKNLSSHVQLIYGSSFSQKEQSILRERSFHCPIVFREEMEVATIISALKNAAKMLKKNFKKTSITIEGDDTMALEIAFRLHEQKIEKLCILDKRGPIYRRRPNMNRAKNTLASCLKLKKDEREVSEILAETHIYISTSEKKISNKITNNLSKNAVIVTLRAEEIEKQVHQSVISTLPGRPNHITDLHIVSGIALALSEGKSWNEKMIPDAISALSAIYKAPKRERIIPGLLEKNLARKIAKAIK